MKKIIFVSLIVSTVVLANAVNTFAFNPQPEPPGDRVFRVNPGYELGLRSHYEIPNVIKIIATRF